MAGPSGLADEVTEGVTEGASAGEIEADGEEGVDVGVGVDSDVAGDVDSDVAGDVGSVGPNTAHAERRRAQQHRARLLGPGDREDDMVRGKGTGKRGVVGGEAQQRSDQRRRVLRRACQHALR